MKKIFIYSALALAVFTTACKKSSTSPTNNTDDLTPANYDLKKSIFRVIVTDPNAPFTVTVTTTNAAKPANNSVQQGQQGAGTTFELPFTPTVGDSIKVVAKATAGPLTLYPSYKSTQLGTVNNSVSSTGVSATFSYLVKD